MHGDRFLTYEVGRKEDERIIIRPDTRRGSKRRRRKEKEEGERGRMIKDKF